MSARNVAPLLSTVLLLSACAEPPTLPARMQQGFQPKSAFLVARSSFDTYRLTFRKLSTCMTGTGFKVHGQVDQETGQGQVVVYSSVGFSSGFLDVDRTLHLQVDIQPAGRAEADVTIYDLTRTWGTHVEALRSHLLEGYANCRT